MWKAVTVPVSGEEVVKKGAEKHYDIWARLYETIQAPLGYKVFAGPFGRYSSAIKAVVSALQGGKDDTFLDVATGTGLVLKEIVRRFGANTAIVGVDISAGALRLAMRFVRKKGLSDTHLVKGDAENLPLRSNVFSRVACSGAFMAFPNSNLALKEMHRVSKPKCRISILYLDENIEHWMGRVLKHAEESHRTPVHLFGEERMRELLMESGFTNAEITKLSGIWRVAAAQRK